MINVIVDKESKYSMSFQFETRAFGVDTFDHRQCTRCDIFGVNPDGVLIHINTGISIRNPVDEWDDRIGMHKALQSAVAGWTSKKVTGIFHTTLDSWF